ncbi:MAG: aconitase/3-isopropylmalate dehydratase large subunit family protein [candidate division KSB1 bacterium]|nr:aconitase/3-isopropylmalate dehydratase large subunit family protein [candidate division KSB1 bacterium]MDZ7336808.1 aconitase/3-isopropylmalate dehydratase large subunit family protein [candidate division KSB1 bacterium]MDZ7356646.1 aconitase/3-isopropylmalate dehydratase large subunit family protein [candidate division KSB1 bacterium]MDZ7398523.1 aconitase/3-isopropylmalate dehydratase large subunit family protein [candidate division KSB1 bacterium]
MGKTMIEKIIESHCGNSVKPGDIVDVEIDTRVARDFGGANVVKHLRDHNLGIADPSKTFFTFDCNPGGSDQKYASNQHICRLFAREYGIKVFDIDMGIGTHVAIEQGLIAPGETFVSTDSHANIMGAIGAFGQGMGDQDIAAAWAYGKVWFKVPATVKVILKGKPSPLASAKDIALAILRVTGANGLLGFASEVYGDIVPSLDLADRITIASMNTEMGGIIMFFPPNQEVIDFCSHARGRKVEPVFADPDAKYDHELVIDIDGLEPLISRPGHPEDVVSACDLADIKIDSAFIGSCTNGRFEDMVEAARILNGRKVAPGVVLKIVPATNSVWRRCLDEGIIDIFKSAGALVGNAGCAGCANGQIGQNGPGEITISTGNRNFAGKQGKGEVYLASPATVAASAVAGIITIAKRIPKDPVLFQTGMAKRRQRAEPRTTAIASERPTRLNGRVWVIRKDNIDTDMIFHNRYLAITDVAQMGQYTFDNLAGWEDFAQKAKPGDIVVTGKNFGAGSSRQQAVDCFKSLGIALIIAESFGAIYERNAINAGMPIIRSDLVQTDIQDGEIIEIDLKTGKIFRPKNQQQYQAEPFSPVQMEIYQRGGLLG